MHRHGAYKPVSRLGGMSGDGRRLGALPQSTEATITDRDPETVAALSHAEAISNGHGVAGAWGGFISCRQDARDSQQGRIYVPYEGVHESVQGLLGLNG